MSNYIKHEGYQAKQQQIQRATEKLQKQYIVAFVLIILVFSLSVATLSIKAKEFEARSQEGQAIAAVKTPTSDMPQRLDELVIDESEQVNTPTITYLGEFKITAYCPCKKCCGKWADNRPTDKDGNKIIYTASGVAGTPGRTVAVDPLVIPYGTKLLINGVEYIAQDTGAKVKGNVLDIMFETHEEAKNWGSQHCIVYVMEGGK